MYIYNLLYLYIIFVIQLRVYVQNICMYERYEGVLFIPLQRVL